MKTPLSVWETARARLRDTLDPDTFSRWIAPLVPLEAADGSLALAVGDDFTKLWIKNNYDGYVDDAVRSVEPGLAHDFVLRPDAVPPPPEPAPLPEPAAGPASSRPGALGRAQARDAGGELRGMPLDPNFTFENFVRGPSNSFAHAAAAQAAANPGGVYNPLLIYGETGLGKTHLMQAVAHAVHVRDARATIVYITLEAMLNDFIESIRTGKAAEFRSRYRHADLLLVDDVQFLTGKTALQEEFFNTFNALQNEHRQIILTSDRPPNKIQGLDDRLVSRFQQGLVTDIQSPDYATRMAILKSKQAASAMPLPDEFLAYIAENIVSNVRQLEGALTRLVCYQNLLGKPITREIMVEQLRGAIDREARAEPTCQDIQRVVAEQFDLRLSDMTSRDRSQNVALPRQIAMFLCRALTRRSLPEIARAFDKTHATVVHACKTVHGRMETDPAVRSQVETACSKLGHDPSDL